MKKSLLVLFALMLAFGASAQSEFRFGPKVGLNMSTLTGDVEDAKMLPGFNVGIVLENSYSSNFFWQVGVQYATKGAKFEGFEIMGFETDDTKTILNYLEMPINFGYKFNVGSAKILAYGGLYVAYGIGGKYKTGDADEDVEWGSGDDETNPFDSGINLGTGLEIKNIQISLQYGFGIGNTSNVDDVKVKNGVFSASVAYLF